MKKIMMLVSMFIMMCSVNSYAGPGEDDGKMKVSISCGCGAVINITVGSSADSVERVDVGCGTDEVVEPVVSH
ncbi:MAG: hypothetical protein LBI80_02060, partial [Endomicrobium sp.]|nr:hypothetical protein [Endomicrobium sp.]